MANDDWITSRGGLRPLTTHGGHVRVGLYKLTTNGTVGCYIGMPMDLDSNGCAVIATSGSDLQYILGPAVGFADTETKGGLPSSMTVLTSGAYLPANKNAYVLVADDPNQEFVIQADTSTTLGVSNIGNTARWAVTRGSNGNTETGSAYVELLASDAAGDTGGSLKIVKTYDVMNTDGTPNDVTANYGKWVVRIHQHRLAPGVNNAV